eukprot:Plantae.Rhodophyta-Rhodochaete_pulchella.ctg3883.p1 GENE.Plantae.Rhodophyta-Rhodochaete_pulchella.ctg3883~~Plantae.Rhodophyta-Rhodochaete_pulchella.ctg3883.p1  ORF type:complete len:620 (+),score=137.18 Plantae.Rhodophyta-Rhodochaete_pulchella.ctg3883:90-1862(+)
MPAAPGHSDIGAVVADAATNAGFDLPAGVDPYEDFDFQPYFEEIRSEDDLRQQWRVFTKVKDVLDNGRRLENASWRLWFKERTKGSSSADELSAMEKFDIDMDQTFRTAQQKTERMVGDMFGDDTASKFQQEADRSENAARIERTQKLLELADKHSLPDGVINDVINWVQLSGIMPQDTATAQVLPSSITAAKDFLSANRAVARKRCAAFGHSLERNGANNFLLYLVRELKDILGFEIFAPKDGPMSEDYKAMGIPVHFCDMKAPDYPELIRSALNGFDYSIANTIMTTEVIIASGELGVQSLWVIHEAWPKEQMNYYAKEVFLMSHLDQDKILKSFQVASKIVFPAQVQQRCYDGLFTPENARVIYNGIPLASINSFRAVQSRDAVRKELGYDKDDLLILHIGTVCKRKSQLSTAQAFSKIRTTVDLGTKQAKLLMVGARYIRQHEIEYIDAIKKELEASGSTHAAQILDVRKFVLPFYLAADVVVCPSINEVLPLVICEAMAFETPVVASRIDGIPEALTDGEEGFLISAGDPEELADRLAKLLTDPDLRQTMGKKGRQRVLSQFSFGTMSRHYRETIFPGAAQATTE